MYVCQRGNVTNVRLIVEAVSEPAVICMQDRAAVHQDQRVFLSAVTGSEIKSAEITFVLDVYLFLQLPLMTGLGSAALSPSRKRS